MFAVIVGFILLFFLACFGSYWDSRQAEQTVSTGSSFVMDTFVDQKLVGSKSGQAVEAVNQELRAFENRISAYDPASEIAKINQNAGVSYVQISEETFALLKTAKAYCAASQGLFDITIGPLADLWDITGEDPHVPKEAEIQEALALVNYEDLLLREEDHSAMLRQTGQKLNLGGMAKGAAGALAMKAAKSYGIRSGYLSLGGNIFTTGRKEEGAAYRFGIRDPRGDAGDYIGVVELTDTTMATSGDYERYFEENGVRYHHILDPATGYPGDGDLISVSVICEDGGMADFLSTVLFLAGREKAMSYANAESFDFILIDRDKNVYLSDGIRPYFTPNEQAVDYRFVNAF
ncbi:MAG: FAD:protein FMN transferase [Oscillospiraceae bacterium]|nr:FAD:protein FMN transferase [Oscillospiraceae bacterium]